MKMELNWPLNAACLLGVVALAGCSGGGNGVANDPFFVGSANEGASGNGLPFAEEGVAFTFSGDTIQVPVLTTASGAAPLPAAAAIERASFTSGAVFGVLGTPTFSIDIDGETVEVVAGEGTLTDGRTVEALRLETRGDAYLVGYGVFDEDTPDALAIFGFGPETSPAAIETLTGTASLGGPFRILAASYVSDALVGTGAELEGVVAIDVNFDDATVSGDIFTDTLLAGQGRIVGDLQEANITGNGAVGTVAWSCDSGATCEGSADYGLVFTGTEGNSVVGLTSIDTAITVGAANLTLVGPAGFIADDLVIAE